MRAILFAAAVLTALPTAGALTQTRAMLAGSELRRNIDFGGLDRYEVMSLNPDGTFFGNFTTRRSVRHGEYEERRGEVRGRWGLEGKTLCFEGTGLEYRGRSCFALSKSGYSVREYAGVHTRTGDIWQFFIYPRGS